MSAPGCSADFLDVFTLWPPLLLPERALRCRLIPEDKDSVDAGCPMGLADLTHSLMERQRENPAEQDTGHVLLCSDAFKLGIEDLPTLLEEAAQDAFEEGVSDFLVMTTQGGTAVDMFPIVHMHDTMEDELDLDDGGDASELSGVAGSTADVDAGVEGNDDALLEPPVHVSMDVEVRGMGLGIDADGSSFIVRVAGLEDALRLGEGEAAAGALGPCGRRGVIASAGLPTVLNDLTAQMHEVDVHDDVFPFGLC